MQLQTLQDLLVEQLQDMYDAEHQVVEALPRMAQSASSPQLKTAFSDHLRQSQQHIQRLERAFQQMGQQATRKPCKAMQGLIAEGQDMMKHDGAADVRDAGLIAAAQRIEHYEIAGYGTARAYARQTGNEQVASLLQQTLEEEGQTDKKLSQLAETQINVQAAR